MFSFLLFAVGAVEVGCSTVVGARTPQIDQTNISIFNYGME